MALVLRIKFPPTYPLIYKTVRIDGKLTGNEAVEYIAETLHVPAGEEMGLYLAHENQWVEANAPINTSDLLQAYSDDNEEVEFRDKNAPITPIQPDPAPCPCIIL
eukprot:TRINITY_DN8856_c3_g1_i1.p1 TRINITY_DN8856_c3_g1~~TRINITY_DN8856_c3_g1_i1.p1  ORF type:complete len:105 (+),score=26.96 TRINITY_DN8856_c3_g1_i1:266-580(+)